MVCRVVKNKYKSAGKMTNDEYIGKATVVGNDGGGMRMLRRADHILHSTDDRSPLTLLQSLSDYYGALRDVVSSSPD